MSINLLKELTKDLESLTPEKLQGFIKGMGESLLLLKEQMESSDPKEREDAVLSALELKVTLEREMEALVQKTGMDLTNVQNIDLNELDPSYSFVQQEIDHISDLFAAPKNDKTNKLNFNR